MEIETASAGSVWLNDFLFAFGVLSHHPSLRWAYTSNACPEILSTDHEK